MTELVYWFRYLIPFYAASLAVAILGSIFFLTAMRLQAVLHTNVQPYEMLLGCMTVSLLLMWLALEIFYRS